MKYNTNSEKTVLLKIADATDNVEDVGLVESPPLHADIKNGSNGRSHSVVDPLAPKGRHASCN